MAAGRLTHMDLRFGSPLPSKRAKCLGKMPHIQQRGCKIQTCILQRRRLMQRATTGTRPLHRHRNAAHSPHRRVPSPSRPPCAAHSRRPPTTSTRTRRNSGNPSVNARETSMRTMHINPSMLPHTRGRRSARTTRPQRAFSIRTRSIRRARECREL